MDDTKSLTSVAIKSLEGLPGNKILTYIRSPQFGIHGESNKLVDIIQVSDLLTSLL